MGNQIKKLETTKTMNIVSKLALGAAIALKGVESSELPLEENFRHLQDKKQWKEKDFDKDDFMKPRFEKEPRYVAKCRVQDKDDKFSARFALYSKKVMTGVNDIYDPQIERIRREQQVIPGVEMNAFVA